MAGAPSGRRPPANRRGGGLRGGRRARGGGVDRRIRGLRLLFVVFLVLAGGKAVALASSSDHLKRIALEQQMVAVELPAHRGAVLDRNGRELAVGTPQQTVYATPYLLEDPGAAARELCDALKIRRKRDRRALEKALAQPDSGFVFVVRKVPLERAKAALDLDLPGVGAYVEEERTYPMKGSAAQVIGFAGVDNQGLAGIELQYDRKLSGVAGAELVVRDAAGRALKTVRQAEPVAGSDVRLTIDADIQYTAEDVLERAVRGSYASAATAIVLDPRSGEILAMATVPKVKGHVFGRPPAADRNRAVTDIYEPGSIFKLVTISGALADGVVRPGSSFTLPPTIRVADREIKESSPRGTVTYSVREILQWSSNVGAVKIGIMMGKKGLEKWMKEFGFGEPTGIGFPDEAAGLVPQEWSGSTIGNIPMGQGIAVTSLQMAQAFATVANDGIAVKPRLVAQVGTTVYDEAEEHRVIPARTAREVRRMLTLAVDEGTGTKARIPGYKVAGKTGTAQKPLPDGSGYSASNYVASFVGMAPAKRPRLVVLVAVDEPRTSIYGGDIAAPAMQKIMRFALNHLEIAP